MSTKGYYIHLEPFNEPGTSYKNDFTVEVRHQDGSLYATFGGSFSEEKKDLVTRVAKNLNTINASPIDKILKNPELRSVSLPLKELQKTMKTGIKHDIVSKPAKSTLTVEEEKKKEKKKRRGLFSSFS